MDKTLTLIGLQPVKHSNRSEDIAPVMVARNGFSFVISARAPLDMSSEDVLHELYLQLDEVFAARPRAERSTAQA